MPDFWSHHFAAITANEKRLLSKPKHLNWSPDSERMYAFGAQGPDFFYYINKLNPLTKHHYKYIGNMIHEKNTVDLFKFMLDYVLKHPAEDTMAYVSGFISHYILDVHCHPLICRLGPDSNTHKRVELDLEAFCIHDYWHQDLSGLHVDSLRCDVEQLNGGFVDLWSNLLPLCYNETVEKKFLLKSQTDLLRVQKMLVNDSVSKLPFPNLLSKWFHYDLSMLRFPAGDDSQLKILREYSVFENYYTAGIDATVEALVKFDEILDHKMTVEQFIETYIIYDFLGEVV